MNKVTIIQTKKGEKKGEKGKECESDFAKNVNQKAPFAER